ncbi:MAG: hypothetical protein NFW16_18605 [Candidatus Accumulibacter sp.]|uniref:hypothetical protein n=1 Tax=Accumulibacter sp. TaxID=2053492 RepID=UPI00258A6528|nr:hypothetical protein [Accumulibacter sp.]MCM8623684.1 hypothetical protein [Accumulibacter sp.]
MFSTREVGSFAEEWISSQSRHMAAEELVADYLGKVPTVWNEVAASVEGLGVIMFGNATVDDLASALETYSVVALLAHHIERSPSGLSGIELCNTVVDLDRLASIAPARPGVVHLGVCRSSSVFIETFKSRCGQVRVIASQAQVEPEFFLRTFAGTVQLWRRDGGDYVQAHVKLRNAMLDSLGAAPL